MNLIKTFLEEAGKGQTDTGTLSNSLKEYYEGATQLQQSAINEISILLCGHSFETLLEMEEEAKSSDPEISI